MAGAGPKSIADIASKYDLVDGQAKRWLDHGAEAGAIEQGDGMVWVTGSNHRTGTAHG
jgi:hypothetical protein